MTSPDKRLFPVTKTLSVALCLSLAATLLTGCWDKQELNDLGLVSGTSFDWVDNQWKMTYQIINPSTSSGTLSGGNGGGIAPPFLTFTTMGSTIFDGAAKSNLTSTRQLFFSHSHMTVIGEKLGAHGIGQLLDLFLRRPDARETVFVFVTQRDPQDILNQLLQISKNQGAGIELMIEQEEKLNSYYPGIRMYELTQALTSDSHCAIVPELVLSAEKVMDKPDDTQVTDLPTRLSLGSLGVFKDDKLIGWMTQEEGLGLSFLTNRVKKSSIPFASNPEKKKEDASFSLLHSKTKVKPTWEKDHFAIDISIRGSGTLLELGSPADLSDSATIKKLEDCIEQKILKEIDLSWKKVQQLKADVTGFAPYIHRKYPKKWGKIAKDKTWDETFEKIELRPRIDITIERFGLSSKSNRTVQED